MLKKQKEKLKKLLKLKVANREREKVEEKVAKLQQGFDTFN
jgi:hypothetical protein